MPPSALFLLLLANTAWAFNFIAGKYGVEHFPPLLFTSIRFSLLLVLLLPFLRPVRGAMWKILQLAVVLGVVHFALMFLGLAYGDDVSPLALASQLYVPFSVLLAIFMLGERPGGARLVGMLVAFAGIVMIGLDPVVFSYLTALLLVIAAAVAMAVATILMRRLPTVGVFTLQAWIAMVAAPSHLLLSLYWESGQLQSIRAAGLMEWAAPLYSAVGASIVGHGIVYFLLRRYPVSLITPMLLLTPLIAVGFGVWLLDDRLSLKIVAGGLVTLLGVALVGLDDASLRWIRLQARNLAWWLLLIVLLPVLWLQVKWLRHRVPRLPVPAGAHSGFAGHSHDGPEPPESRRVLFVGESPIAGTGVEQGVDGVVVQAAEALARDLAAPVCWVRLGIDGARLAELAERLPGLATDAAPYTEAVVCVGVNDTTGLTSLRRWRAGLERITLELRRIGVRRIHYCAVPPLGQFPALPHPLRDLLGMRAAALDGQLRRFAADSGAGYIPMPVPLRPDWFAADGFHPGTLGCRVWGQAIAVSLQARPAPG